jgi:hypothetical protein
MVTFTINIPQMLAYIPAPWILWDMGTINMGFNMGTIKIDFFFLGIWMAFRRLKLGRMIVFHGICR